jgi:hypothetical protein
MEAVNVLYQKVLYCYHKLLLAIISKLFTFLVIKNAGTGTWFNKREFSFLATDIREKKCGRTTHILIQITFFLNLLFAFFNFIFFLVLFQNSKKNILNSLTFIMFCSKVRFNIFNIEWMISCFLDLFFFVYL